MGARHLKKALAGKREVMWLSRQQIEELTGRKRPSAQIRVLTAAGLLPGKDFLVVDGRPILPDTALPQPQKRVRRL